MGVPTVYRNTKEQTLANYKWTDIADGTGKVTLYACNWQNTAGTIFNFLSDKNYRNADVDPDATSGLIFDLSGFNTPRTVKGRAYIECQISTSSGDGYITVKLQKVRGATVTDISSEIGTYGNDWCGTHIAEIALTETVFGVGDILRLCITGVGSNCQLKLNTSLSEICKIDIPFKIDL